MGSILNQYKLPITSKDFVSLEASFKQYIIDQYSGDISDITITEIMQALIDIMAIAGDSFYRESERAGGEQTLAGAVEPQSILDLCYSIYGYIPRGTTTAMHSCTLTSSATDSFTIPVRTRFSTVTSDGSSSVNFETMEEYKKPLGKTTSTLIVRQGITKFNSTVASGDANLLIKLDHTQIDTSTIVVIVNSVLWEEVNDFSGSLPTDQHYRIRVMEVLPGIRTYNVLFGSGSQGRIPNAGSNVSISYVSPGGVDGNVPVNTITKVSSDIVDGNRNTVATFITNDEILVRGQDEESVDISRIKAPLLISIHGGIVNLEDYESAALLEGAVRAVAYTDEENPGIAPNTVLLLIIYDLVDLPTASETLTLKSAIETNNKVNGTGRLVISSGTFEDVSINITVYAEKGVTLSVLKAEISTVLAELFSLTSTVGPVPEFIVDIGKSIPYSHITEYITPLTGVYKVTFPDLSGGFDSIVPASNAILRVTPNLTVKTRGT